MPTKRPLTSTRTGGHIGTSKAHIIVTIPAIECCDIVDNAGMCSGQWLGSQKHGVGIYEYPSEAMYAGQWINNVKDGYGTYKFARGGLYKVWRLLNPIERSSPDCTVTLDEHAGTMAQWSHGWSWHTCVQQWEGKWRFVAGRADRARTSSLSLFSGGSCCV